MIWKQYSRGMILSGCIFKGEDENSRGNTFKSCAPIAGATGYSAEESEQVIRITKLIFEDIIIILKNILKHMVEDTADIARG